LLRSLAPDLWVTERPLRFLGVEIGTRMTVARLSDGGLFVHSPVPLDAPARRELDAFGPVRAVVAPNRLHHLFVGAWREAHPDASVYGAPGLAEKRRDLAFDAVLGDEAPPAWAADLDQLVFRAIPLLNEVVFFHRASRTLVLTDIAFNVRRADSWLTRAVLRLDGAYGRFGVSRIGRAVIRDRRAARAAIDRMLGWDFDRVIVAHGEVLERGGRDALREAFAWL
jgi:hypothetical protein